METTNNDLQTNKKQVLEKKDVNFVDSIFRIVELATLVDCLDSTLSELEPPAKVINKILTDESVNCQTLRQTGIEAYKQHLYNAGNIIALMKNMIKKIDKEVVKAMDLIEETEKIKLGVN
ncbi:MAG: hypothetical protein HYS24_12945 [Ignavibacteriales bacterium]|nr:hypothetical protein [Ignavibacteriales bacterium]